MNEYLTDETNIMISTGIQVLIKMRFMKVEIGDTFNKLILII